MINLIHGNDTSSSRNYFINEKLKFKDAIIIDGKKLDFNFIFSFFEGNSLFTQENILFIENFFSANNKTSSLEYKKIIEYINLNKSLNIYIWEDKELSKSQITQFNNTKISLFNYPQNLFIFLDNIKPNNLSLIKQFHQLKSTMESELVFFMIIRHFRLLLCSIQNSNEYPLEYKRLAPWQLTKLKKQAELFGENKLKTNYKKLYTIDYELKFGLRPYNLDSAIDIFLAYL